jgi:hypothetical protein
VDGEEHLGDPMGRVRVAHPDAVRGRDRVEDQLRRHRVVIAVLAELVRVVRDDDIRPDLANQARHSQDELLAYREDGVVVAEEPNVGDPKEGARPADLGLLDSRSLGHQGRQLVRVGDSLLEAQRVRDHDVVDPRAGGQGDDRHGITVRDVMGQRATGRIERVRRVPPHAQDGDRTAHGQCLRPLGCLHYDSIGNEDLQPCCAPLC